MALCCCNGRRADTKYICTLRIHPSLDSNWIGASKAPTLAGPKYIPFRSSLSNNLHVVGQEQHKLKIAVVAGESDPCALVHEIARILVMFSEQFKVYLFTNSMLDSGLDSRFQYFDVSNQLDELKNNVGIVLTTSSTSYLEFLERGFCIGITCAVDNQEKHYDSLGELGVAAQIGLRNLDNNWELDKGKIYSLIASSELRGSLIAKTKGLIDFMGASRIVDAITTL